LAEGVNLPVQTFILGYHQTFSKYRLSVRDFKNIVGRAGRALVQTEGRVIAIRHPEFSKHNEDSDYFDSLIDLDESRLTLRSGFPPSNRPSDGDRIIAELSALAEAVKDVQSLAEIEYVEDLADELQRLQVLIFTLFEDGIVDTTLASVREALQTTLLFTQASSPRMQDAVVGLSQAFLHICAQMNSSRLRRFNASGLRFKSNCLLEELASDVNKRCVDLPADQYSFENVITRQGLEFLLENIREARPTASEYGAKKYEVVRELDHYGATLDWLGGNSFAHIRDTFFSPIPDLASRTEVCQSYISKQFVFRLPWVLSALQIHAEQAAHPTLNWWLRTLPAQVKYGVNTPEAVYLSSIGIRSRFLSIALAQLYREDRGVVLESDWEPLGKWFRELSPFYLRQRLPDLPELAIRQAIRRANSVRPPSKELRNRGRVLFNVAGWRHYDGEAIIDRLREEGWRADKPLVQLRLEAGNLYDEYAVEIYWLGNKLGYVPRSNNEEIALLLALGRTLQAKIMTVGSRRSSGWRPVEVMVELVPKEG
jgi:hypothetical protein